MLLKRVLVGELNLLLREKHQKKEATINCIVRGFYLGLIQYFMHFTNKTSYLICRVVFRNALSLAMLESLKENLEEDVDDPNLRVIVLKGEGPVFSAGHDLKEMVMLDCLL